MTDTIATRKAATREAEEVAHKAEQAAESARAEVTRAQGEVRALSFHRVATWAREVFDSTVDAGEPARLAFVDAVLAGSGITTAYLGWRSAQVDYNLAQLRRRQAHHELYSIKSNGGEQALRVAVDGDEHLVRIGQESPTGPGAAVIPRAQFPSLADAVQEVLDERMAAMDAEALRQPSLEASDARRGPEGAAANVPRGTVLEAEVVT